MTMYAKFTENNEWEAETWRFYIPIEGNEDALKQLNDVLIYCDYDVGEGYCLDLTPLPETEVDILVKHSDMGYMADHNKLSGQLLVSPEALERIRVGKGGDEDELYKGGIRDFMKDPIG